MTLLSAPGAIGRLRAMSAGSKALAVVAIGVSMSALDTTIVNVARDAIAKDFTSSRSDVSWVLAGYSIVFAAVLLTSGRLADRYGRKRLYTTGLLLFVTASALCGLAPSLGWLIAGRGVQAIGGALLTPAALAIVLPLFPMEKRSAAIGVWGSVGSVAAASGPVIGGWLVDKASWRAAFYVNVPIGLLAFAVGRRMLPESRDEHAKGVPDVVSIVAGVGAVALIALAISKGNEWGFVSTRARWCFVAALLLMFVFVRRSMVARLPVLDLSLLRSRAFSVANISTLLFAVPFYGSVVANVEFLQRVWHYSAAGSGTATLLAPVTAIAVARPVGRLCDRIGHRRVVPPAACAMALALLGMATFTPATPAYWTRFAPFQVLIGIGIGSLITGLQSGVVKFVPQNRIAMASAFHATLRQVGSALAVAITIAALSRPGRVLGNFDVAWTIQGCAAIAVALVMGLAFRAPTLPAVNRLSVTDR